MKFLTTTLIALMLPAAALSMTRVSTNNDILMALSMPIKNRVQILKSSQLSSYEELQNLAFDKSQSMNVRWRAMTTLGVMYKDNALPAIERGLKSKEWFIRNSALIALKYCSKPVAVSKTLSLLTDRALVVRTAVMQNLNSLKAKASKEQVWRQIFNSINFRNGKSLWVRDHMAKFLVKFASSVDKEGFVKLLSDKDLTIQKLATRGLEKSYGFKLGEKKDDRTVKVTLWRDWLQKNSFSAAY